MSWRKPSTAPEKGQFIAAYRWSATDRLRVGIGEWCRLDAYPGITVDGVYVPCIGWMPLPDAAPRHDEFVPLHLRRDM